VSDFSDWDDPFAEDEAARERERRRAEREASRRTTREQLGEKAVTAGSSAEPNADAPAPPERPARQAPPAGGGPPPPGPIAGETPGGGAIPPRELLVRRVIGAVLVIAAVVFVGFLAGKVWGVIEDVVGGDDPVEQVVPAETSEITIPEGLDRTQIAAVAEEAGIRGNYLAATKEAPKGFPIDRYAPDGAPNLEGFLFPDTWNDLPKRATVDDIVSRQLDTFQTRIKTVDMSYAESKNLNVYDVLKIASMVEREIAVDKERKLAAAVIYNRLAAGDTLGIDATIRYEDQNYDEPIDPARLEEETPYNTRTNAGLPPTPIGNPGLASIEAAANPARSDAYYFVIKPGSCNRHVFVETEEEFLEAEAAYQQALEEEGGSPTEC
jgi:UPF0755 protein